MFRLTIANAEESLFDGEAYSATCPVREGEVTVLAHHEPFIGVLDEGSVKIRLNKDDADTKNVAISGGVLEVSSGGATILL